MTIDGRLARGERTRTAVLDVAVKLATTEGLEGLSLSQLAAELEVSKSGLFAHWATKTDLQLATVQHAIAQWTAEVVTPALRAPRGVRRLWAIHEQRLDFYSRGVLPGGCFFATAQFEFAVHEGTVRDLLVAAFDDWSGLLVTLATQAIDLGELQNADPEQLAFEIDAVGIAAGKLSRLSDEADIYRKARRAVLLRLRAGCPNPKLLPKE